MEKVIDFRSSDLPQILVGTRYVGAEGAYRDVLLKSSQSGSRLNLDGVREPLITYADHEGVRSCSVTSFKRWMSRQKRALRAESLRKAKLFWASHEELALGLSVLEANDLAKEIFSLFEPYLDEQYLDSDDSLISETVKLLLGHSFVRERVH